MPRTGPPSIPGVETATVTLTPLCPIRIGSNTPEYGAADLVHEGRVYVVDERKLGPFLQERGLLTTYLKYFEGQYAAAKKESLVARFINKHLSDERAAFIQDVCRPDSYRVDDDKSFIRDGNNRAFIPGSSIKGALRTAVLWKMYEEWPRGKSVFKTRVDKIFGMLEEEYRVKSIQQISDFNARRGVAKEIQKDLLQSVEYMPNANGSHSDVPDGPHRDLMRAVSVSDSSSISEDDLCPYTEDLGLRRRHEESPEAEICVLTLKQGKPRIKTTFEHQFYDYPEPESNSGAHSVSFTIRLDLGLLSRMRLPRSVNTSIPFSSLRELFELAREFSQRVWEREQGYFDRLVRKHAYSYESWGSTDLVSDVKDFYASDLKQACGLRVGYGSGLWATTLWDHLEEDVDQRTLLRNLGLKKNRSNQEVPKSRRLVRWKNGLINPMGWVQLDVDYHDDPAS
jgi:CRISPR-associated protein Csm5